MSPRKEKDQRIARLHELAIFANCPDEELERIEHLGSEIRVHAGEKLVREHTVGMECLIVLDGHARVLRDGTEIAGIGPGSIVGEQALVTHQSRNADVVAASDMRLLVYTPSEFAQVMADAPSVRKVVDRAVAERSAQAQG